MFPRIYLTETPATAHARRLLRLRALDLHQRLGRIDDGPCYLLLNLPGGAGDVVDLLVLRPGSLIVGAVKEVDGPVDARPDGQWVARTSGFPLESPQGETPLAQIRRVQSDLRRRLEPLGLALGTIVGAIIVAPSVHPESRVMLTVEDHRQRIKLLGLDELAPLASMLQAGADLDEPAMQRVASALGARLWHDGEQLLFEIGMAPYQLLVRGAGARAAQALPLLEGASVIGRREAPLQHEYRLTIVGDDSISADHAIIICGADGRVTLRDTSTNGSYILTPEGEDLRVHHAERAITPRTVIRMGETELELERLED